MGWEALQKRRFQIIYCQWSEWHVMRAVSPYRSIIAPYPPLQSRLGCPKCRVCCNETIHSKGTTGQHPEQHGGTQAQTHTHTHTHTHTVYAKNHKPAPPHNSQTKLCDGCYKWMEVRFQPTDGCLQR